MFKKIVPFLSKKWKLIVPLVFLIIGGIFFVSFYKKDKNLKTAVVQKGKIAQELILSGTVAAKNYAQLTFETSGKIVYVGVSEGEKVKKGRLLSKLDTVILNSEYQRALSDLRYYEANVEYVHDQVKGNDDDETFAQKDTRTYSEVNKDKAYENVIKAKRNLDGASLYAPFDGIITYVANPFAGVNIIATTPQIEIIDPSTIYLEVLADQTEIVDIYSGQKVKIVLDAFESEEFEGTVETVSFTPVSDESSSYPVKIKFEGIDLLTSQFKIGMTGDVKFIIEEKDNVLYIDSSFVNSDKNGKYVKTNEKNGKVYIEIGLESEDYTEIEGDISEGQTLYD